MLNRYLIIQSKKKEFLIFFSLFIILSNVFFFFLLLFNPYFNPVFFFFFSLSLTGYGKVFSRLKYRGGRPISGLTADKPLNLPDLQILANVDDSELLPTTTDDDTVS